MTKKKNGQSREMYNSTLKNAFIRQYSNNEFTIRNIVSFFRAISKYEYMAGKDMCTMSADELNAALDKVLPLSSTTRRTTLLLIKSYINFCIDAGVSGVDANVIDSLRGRTGEDKIRSQMVASPAELQKVLNEFLDPEAQFTMDNVYRCFFWFAYSGMPQALIKDIKASNVDFTHKIIVIDDTEYPIYKEELPALNNIVTLNQFVYHHPKYARVMERDRYDSDNIMRGIKSDFNPKTASTAIAHKILAAEERGKKVKNLSYYRTYMSGMFYRIYKNERIGKLMTIVNLYGKDIITGNKVKRADAVYKQNMYSDYISWKDAFNLWKEEK